MTTFEERLRARIQSLIDETMQDVASEVRKAVVPKPEIEPETCPVCLDDYASLHQHLIDNLKGCGDEFQTWPLQKKADRIGALRWLNGGSR